MARYLGRLKRGTKRTLRPLAGVLATANNELAIDHWNLSVSRAGRLSFAGHDVLDLVAAHGTPVHLLDVRRLDANLDALTQARSVRGRRLEVFYSVKTQPLPWVVKRLLSRGAGAEVISEYELRLALHLGASPAQIVFNGPAKSEGSLRLAIEAGIALVNINHLEQVDRIANLAGRLRRKLRVGVRVTTESGWGSQFGCSIALGEAFAAYERALARPELEVVGLHSHRGNHIYHPAALIEFVDEVLDFASLLRDRLGFEPEIIDFGGSLGIPTVRPYTALDHRLAKTLFTPVGGPDPRTRLSLEAYAQTLLGRIDAHASTRAGPPPRIAVEPGRAISGNAQALATRVMGTRRSADGIDYAVLDGGINIAGVLALERHQIFKVARYGEPATRRYRLVGPICQPGDTVCACVRLPPLVEGDVLLIMDSGAYFEPDSSAFSFPRPATIALDGERVQTIRRAETFADMIGRDAF